MSTQGCRETASRRPDAVPPERGDGVLGRKSRGDGVREVGGTAFYAKTGERGDGVRNPLNATLCYSALANCKIISSAKGTRCKNIVFWQPLDGPNNPCIIVSLSYVSEQCQTFTSTFLKVH